MTSQPENKMSLSTKFKYFLEVSVFLLIIASTWMLHVENKEQIERLSKLVSKYEIQLDKAISADPELYKRYSKNLSKALSSLSDEERKVLLAIYAVDK